MCPSFVEAALHISREYVGGFYLCNNLCGFYGFKEQCLLVNDIYFI